MSFDLSKIQAAFVGLVGIHQPFDPAYQKLDVSFESSSSGLYLDNVSNYKTEYWIDTQDYKDITNTDLSIRMGQIRDGSVSSVLSQVFTEPSYIDRNKIFSQTFDRQNVITQQGNGQTFYGYEIIAGQQKNVAFKITKCTLEMVGAGDITIQLYNSSKLEPLFSQVVTIGGGTSLEEVELNWFVDSTMIPYKGSYFLGYYKNSNVQPIDRNYEGGDLMNSIKGLDMERIMIQDDFLNLSSLSYESDHNGLNFDITTQYDYTDLVLQNEKMFAKSIQLTWAMTVMLSFTSSHRINSKERMSKEMMVSIIRSIEGQKEQGQLRIVGVRELLAGEVVRTKEEIDKVKFGYFNDDDEYLIVATQT